MPLLFAHPYDISASGFYFEDIEDYKTKSSSCINHYGQKVEEFEIQFIDGDTIDCELFNAWGIFQSNFEDYLNACNDLNEIDKIKRIILSNCGYSLDENLNDDEIELYLDETLEGLAQSFLDEGLFGEVPNNLIHYIDIEKLARDLSVDYTQDTINNISIVYRCS